MAIEIKGASDDVVCIRETETRDAVYQRWADEMHPNKPIRIGTNEGGIVVTMHYSPANSGVWSASVRQMNEDCPIPWKVEIETAPPNGHPPSTYSVLVRVWCPLGTPIKSGRKTLPRAPQ